MLLVAKCGNITVRCAIEVIVGLCGCKDMVEARHCAPGIIGAVIAGESKPGGFGEAGWIGLSTVRQ
jgi:hypothetical protein